ncbi:MAG: hypothetical protein AB8G95_15720 [Anaerolineae bacterium]
MKSRFNIVVFILSITALFLSACRGSDGAFGPISPTPTQIGVVNRPPVPVDFETLDSDPFVFVDRFVRVTGRYVPPRQIVCARQRGPSIDWFLISDELEMNMSGFGSIVGIAPDQAFFTVDGIWRRYKGPVGCAKEPEDQTIWYLEVVRIVDPNPLVASTNSSANITAVPSTNISIDPQPEATAEPNSESITIEPTTSQTAIPSPTATLNTNTTTTPTTPTPTIFVVATSITPTSIATATVQNNNSTTTTPTPTAAASAQPSATATATVTPTDDAGGLGGTGSGTPNASTPVPTPNGGYPAPDASPTTNPYP